MTDPKSEDEFRDCLDDGPVIEQLHVQLNAASFVEQENQIHPSLQLAESALAKGFAASQNDVVPHTPTTPTTPTARSSGSDPEKAGANVIVLNPVDLKTIGENTLSPTEQEKEGKRNHSLAII